MLIAAGTLKGRGRLTWAALLTGGMVYAKVADDDATVALGKGGWGRQLFALTSGVWPGQIYLPYDQVMKG